MSGNHLILAPQVVRLLREKGMDRTAVVLGGTVAPQDRPTLKAAGIAEVFGPGSSLKQIVEFISERAQPERGL